MIYIMILVCWKVTVPHVQKAKKVAGQKGRTEHAEDVLTHSGAEGTDYLVLAFHVF